MHPQRVRRDALHQLTDLPNIGPSMADSLRLLDMHTPEDLCGRDPIALYLELCRRTASRQDPCVLDTLIAVTRFMAGDDPAPLVALHRRAQSVGKPRSGGLSHPNR